MTKGKWKRAKVNTITSKHAKKSPSKHDLEINGNTVFPKPLTFSHMHTLSLSRSSRFWLTFPCAPTAKQPQDRDKQNNTQTNDKFTTSQTSVYRSGRGQRIKRKTVREVRCVSFQVLQGHLVAEQYRQVLLTDGVFPNGQGNCYSAMAEVLNAALVRYLLALICSWSLLYISRTEKQRYESFVMNVSVFLKSNVSTKYEA